MTDATNPADLVKRATFEEACGTTTSCFDVGLDGQDKPFTCRFAVENGDGGIGMFMTMAWDHTPGGPMGNRDCKHINGTFTMLSRAQAMALMIAIGSALRTQVVEEQ